MKLTFLQRLVLYTVVGALFGAILPDLIPDRYLKYLELALIVVPVFGMAQMVLFTVGVHWLRRQMSRIEQGEPEEPQPWYMDWNEFITGRRNRRKD